VLKCEASTPLKANFEACSGNLKNEIETLNPVATIVCGREPVKWFKKLNRPFIELPSLSVLFRGKKGINLMKMTLKALKDTYIG
jgi:uracil-DNA glycosylase